MWAEIAKSGLHLGTKHTTTTMAWLRPRTTSDLITLPSYIYVKCSSIFQSSGWSYGCIFTSSKPCAWAEVAESDSELGTNHTTMTWLRPGSCSDWITLPHYTYIVFKHLPMQWMVLYRCILTSSKPWVWAEIAESGLQ